MFSHSTIQFWHDDRIKRVLIALYGTLLLTTAILIISGVKNMPLLTSGDFPGFYAPAVILSQGEYERLYELELQKEIEDRYFDDFDSGFYIFAYPPYTALALKPLAALSPGVAKWVFVLFHLCSALVTFAILSRYSENTLQYFALLLFPPLIISIIGAQNTAFTLLLFALFAHGLLLKSASGEYLSGVSAALMLYKPQFGVFFCLYLLVRGGARSRTAVIVTSALLYLLTAAAFGFSWPIWWLTAVTDFGDKNFTINAYQMVSLVGALYSTAESTELFTTEFALSLGYILSFLLIGFLYLFIATKSLSLKNTFILLGFSAVILSPQTLVYDTALCIVPFLLVCRFHTDFQRSVTLLLIALFMTLYLVRSESAFSLSFLGVLLFLGATLQLASDSNLEDTSLRERSGVSP